MSPTGVGYFQREGEKIFYLIKYPQIYGVHITSIFTSYWPPGGWTRFSVLAEIPRDSP